MVSTYHTGVLSFSGSPSGVTVMNALCSYLVRPFIRSSAGRFGRGRATFAHTWQGRPPLRMAFRRPWQSFTIVTPPVAGLVEHKYGVMPDVVTSVTCREWKERGDKERNQVGFASQ
eukprot:350699-Chlamydomonas_euryale.AAC.16